MHLGCWGLSFTNNHMVCCAAAAAAAAAAAGVPQVRMVDARPGIAFIEFDSDLSSTTAMAGLQGFKITPEKAMQLTYAKQ
jgi:hypothetical protein